MTGSSGWTRALAPAKVNPFLEVVARRDDGYHELDTALVALELADVVAVRASDVPGVRIVVRGEFASPDVPSDDRNLAVATARAVLAHSSAVGLELELVKNVPSQAGLGGGSADAAAALLASEHALGVRLDPREADALLAALGSDCLFFRAAASTGFGRCRGRGELVEPLELGSGDLWVVLVTPLECVATAAVYRALASGGALRGPRRDFPEGSLKGWTSAPFNRLEPAALESVPSLTAWRGLLEAAAPARFALAGSGSSFFALFSAEAEARRTLERLRERLDVAALRARGLWLTRASKYGARLVP